jgi:hypothetical protein
MSLVGFSRTGVLLHLPSGLRLKKGEEKYGSNHGAVVATALWVGGRESGTL